MNRKHKISARGSAESAGLQEYVRGTTHFMRGQDAKEQMGARRIDKQLTGTQPTGTQQEDIQLTGTQLKWIALVTMIIDHVGVALLQPGSSLYWAARLVGRLAFPLYCFLLVEGFCHTRNVGKYLGRLVLFAVISEIPFDMMNGALVIGSVWNTSLWNISAWNIGAGGASSIWASQNVYVTLAIGLVALMGYVRLQNQNQPIPAILWCVLMSGLAWWVRADYDFAGVALICIFYRFRQEPRMRAIWGSGTLLLAMSPVEFPALLDFGLMSLYRGKRGDDRWKWMFYVAYPLHLLVLGLLRGSGAGV